MSAVIIYDRNRFPIQPGPGLCRGCHGPVPKGRRTWCSDECDNRFNPFSVRLACKKRDKEVCCMCGCDTRKMKARLKTFQHFNNEPNFHHPRFYSGLVFNREKFELVRLIWARHRVALYKAADKRRIAMRARGWPAYPDRDWWDMDHIQPFSEGGKTVLENVRTVCVPCHKGRTKQWHRERKINERQNLEV